VNFVKGFDSLPGVLFLGIRKPNNVFEIGLVAANGHISYPAHTKTITSFEFCTANGINYLISGSLDSKIIVWEYLGG
jgi:hypothetical protein